jgi:hypothetical protein
MPVIDPLALYMAPAPSAGELARAGFNRFDYFAPEDFRALARPAEMRVAKVVDIATRRALRLGALA